MIRIVLSVVATLNLAASAEPVFDRAELEAALRFLALHRIEVFTPNDSDKGFENGVGTVKFGLALSVPATLALALTPRARRWSSSTRPVLEAFGPPFAMTGILLVLMGGAFAVLSKPKRDRILARDPNLRRRRDLIAVLDLPMDEQVALLSEDRDRVEFVLDLAHVIQEQERIWTEKDARKDKAQQN